MAVLSDADKERTRYHTGYMETSFAASIQLGIPRPVQTMFLLEQAMNLIIDQNAINRVVRTLNYLDFVECQLQKVAPHLAAEQLGNLKLRGAKRGETYPDLLEREYIRWAKRLADILGVPLYPYSGRFGPGGAAGSGNIPVRNS